jgi:hypothetical protein|tara:strand:+ start:683 stop:946 length:264 start_codon:yes stop_codon:yes gene_type:complete
MELSKKITGCIWDKCAKQIVDGYVYVKMDDIIKINIEEEDLIVDNMQKHQKNQINMNQVASYLNKLGWVFERIPNEKEMWKKEIKNN